jgi:hypothetical protein
MLLLSAVAAFLLILGFAVGYGARELVSRRRRAAAKRKFYERQSQKELTNRISLRKNNT